MKFISVVFQTLSFTQRSNSFVFCDYFRPQLSASQAFNLRDRVFSFTEGIEANRNFQLGRIMRQRFRPAKKKHSELDGLLGIGVGVIGAVILADILF
jgi:hypothetical protein